jgi:tRNA A37 threonylcarbamoyladenosine synthetase subunit TsaC/SUA5/YrdC
MDASCERLPDCPVKRAFLDCLGRGELVVIPTDTVYGLAGDPRVNSVEDRIYSANRSGSRPALNAGDAVQALGPHLAAVLDCGPSPGGQASTVVRVEEGALTVLRHGAIREEECRSVL